MPARRPDPGLEQWRRRVEATETIEKPTESEKPMDEESAETQATREEPQVEDDRSYWEFKRRPYWR
jgi:hypothetical protein